MQPDLTVSIISADNLDLLLPCLRSLYENTHHATLELYVVDNASSNSTAAVVEAEFPKARVVRNSVRRGFSTNNNMILEQGRGRYLMLLNDDTLVLDGALDRMVEFMDAHPQAGAVGAFLLHPDGSIQLAFSRFPQPFFEALWPAKWWYRTARQAPEPFDVDVVSGAALMVRRQTMEQVGGLDPSFDPIYSEEVDWCYRIKQADWRIYTLPRAQIIHYGGQTMNRDMPHKYELLLSHKALFFRKHQGSRAARIYKALLALATASKLAWWTCGSLVTKDRETNKQRVRLHRYLLKRIPSL